MDGTENQWLSPENATNTDQRTLGPNTHLKSICYKNVDGAHDIYL